MRRLAELRPDYEEFIQMNMELPVKETVKALHKHFGAPWNFEIGGYDRVPDTLTEEDEWWMSGAQAEEHFFFQMHIHYHIEPPFAEWPREDYWIKEEALDCVFYFARDTWWREVRVAEEPHIRWLLDNTLKGLNQAKSPYGGYRRHDTHQIIAKRMMEQEGAVLAGKDCGSVRGPGQCPGCRLWIQVPCCHWLGGNELGPAAWRRASLWCEYGREKRRLRARPIDEISGQVFF